MDAYPGDGGMMVCWLTRSLVALSSILLAAAYAGLNTASGWKTQAALPAAGLLLGAGAIWLIATRRSRGGLSTAVFAFFTLAAGLGFLVYAERTWLVLGAAAALTAWDLESFSRRIQRAGHVDKEALLVRRHLVRLGSTLALAFGAVALTFWVPVSLGPLTAAGLGMLAIFALARGITTLRKQG